MLVEVEDSESKVSVVDVAQTLKRFFDGDPEAGEYLLELSGVKRLDVTEMGPILVDVLRLQMHSTQPRCAELSCGIVANLCLDDRSQFSLCGDVMEACLNSDDPYTIAEALRAMGNMLCKGRVEELEHHLPALSDLSLSWADNSLSATLIGHLAQTVYYLHVYAPSQTLERWYESWSAPLFFQCILFPSEDTTMVADLKNQEIVDRNGLEWLLLCLDNVTTTPSRPTVADVLDSTWLTPLVLTLLLGSGGAAWVESGTTGTGTSTAGRHSTHPATAISLAPAETFPLLSILENLVSYCLSRDSIAALQEWWEGELRDEHGASRWPAVLGKVIETLEEAVLLQDSYAVNSVVYLICTLFAPEVNTMPRLEGGPPAYVPAQHQAAGRKERLADAVWLSAGAICDVAELVTLPDNVGWAWGVTTGEYSVRDMCVLFRDVLVARAATVSSKQAEEARKALHVLNAVIANMS